MSSGAEKMPKPGVLRTRRIRRLEREIALLSQMDDKLWRWTLICAALIIVGLSVAFALAAAKLHYFEASPAQTLSFVVLFAIACWWGGRYSLWIPWLMLNIAVAISFEDTPDFGGPPDIEDRKAARRIKVARAIERRRHLLAKLEAQS